MAMAMATTKSKSLTIHSGKPGSTLSTLRPETTLKKAFTAGHCCRAGREDTQQGTSTDWIEYQFSDFHVFHVFSWRFSVFTFFFLFFQLSVVVAGAAIGNGDTQAALLHLPSHLSFLVSTSYSTLGCPIWIWMEMILLDFHIFIMLPGICARSRSRSKLPCCCCSCYSCFCCLPYRDPQRFAFSATAWQVHLSLLNCFKIP